ncbi:unnamed protein product [Ectocarpus sp. 8 AP-2014]
MRRPLGCGRHRCNQSLLTVATLVRQALSQLRAFLRRGSRPSAGEQGRPETGLLLRGKVLLVAMCQVFQHARDFSGRKR